jgi:hypothetical protein
VQSEFVIANAVDFNASSTTALFANNGTLNISLPTTTGAFRMSAYMSHRGQLNILQGIFTIAGGSELWAPVTIATPGAINFAGATTNINVGTNVVSSGTMYYSGGNANYQYVSRS